MVYLSVQSVLVLLIVAPCVYSPSSAGILPKFFTSKLFPSKSVKNPSKGQLSAADNGIPDLGKNANFAHFSNKRKGVELAEKYLGPGGQKGVRYGFKLGKRYYKVASKCEEYDPKLRFCTPNSTPPPPPVKYHPSCVLQCIVEIGEIMIKNNNTSYCVKYNGCIPQEATCTLDQPELC